MKKLVLIPFCLALLASPAAAGKDEPAAQMDPATVTAVATASDRNSTIIVLLVLTAIALAVGAD